MFIREGTPNGFNKISTGCPSAINGISSIGKILEMTPLLPWRPDILSPSEILRFWTIYTLTRIFTPGGRSDPSPRLNTRIEWTIPAPPWGTFNELSRTSRDFSPKIANNSFSSGLTSLCPFGVTLPTKISPSLTSAPTMMIPFESNLRTAASPTLGISRVISSGPNLVSRQSISYSSTWIEVYTSSLTIRSDMMMASS